MTPRQAIPVGLLVKHTSGVKPTARELTSLKDLNPEVDQ